MNSPVNAQMEHLLLIVIVQLIIIVAAARIFGVIFRYLGQPQVCGEIAAGLILGPSLFGRLFPNLFGQVFQPSVALVFSMLSQIGLLLLMFLIGLEFDFSHLRTHGHIALSISLAGIILPFRLGLGVAQVLYAFVGQHINSLGSSPFLCRWTARMLRTGGGELSLSGLAFLLILIFLSAAITILIGLFSIFGAFIMGAVLYDQHEFREAVSRRLRDFVTVFFLPIFF